MPLTPPDRRDAGAAQRGMLMDLARAARHGEAIASATKAALDSLRTQLHAVPETADFRASCMATLEMQSVTLMTEGAYFLGRASGLEAAAKILEGGPDGTRDP